MAKPRTRTAIKALNYVAQCGVCKLSLKKKDLHQRILNSRKFFPSNKQAETIQSIADYYGIGYLSLIRHIKNHVAINPEEVLATEMQRLANRADAQDKLEAMPTYNAGPQPGEVWNDVIQKAKEGLEDGTIKLTANHLLKAAKDKSDFEIKKKNQDMAIQEMMWHFASGEAKNSTNYDRRIIEGGQSEDYNPAEIFAGIAPEGEERPSDLHSGATGDATPPRTDTVLEGDDF